MSTDADTNPLEDPVVRLVTDIMAASAAQNHYIMDQLYEAERAQRQALEVHIDQVLDHFGQVAGGTTREYERAVAHLARLPYGEERERLAALHYDRIHS